MTSSPPGISCETFFCAAYFPTGSSVALAATPHTGFAFAGFGGDCTGPSCALTMDGPKIVTVNFIRFAVLVHSKLKRDRANGTATITIRVGGPGALVLAGKHVKRQTRAPTAASNLKVPIVPKGATARRLRETGAARVGIRVTFTPGEGTPATLRRPARLIGRP